MVKQEIGKVRVLFNGWGLWNEPITIWSLISAALVIP